MPRTGGRPAVRRLVFPLLLGLVGCAVLVSLGLWQLHRLEWKRAILAGIEARVALPPVALPPAHGDSRALKYTPVTVEGRTGPEIHVLSGMHGQGAGYEVITALTTPDGRHILLDRGFVPEAGKDAPRPPVELKVLGNLHWPQEAGSSTPEPDLPRNIWFARDVTRMAAALGTESLLVVARSVEGDRQGLTPVPVSTSGIPNDHLNYAITWFSLAGVWAGMTVFLLWRIRLRKI